MSKNKQVNHSLFINSYINPVHARIANIDGVVVAHDNLKAAIDGLKECISWSQTGSEPRGAVLVGVGGCGKTTICNAIVKMFPPVEIVEEDRVIQVVPAFYASVPSPSTIKSLAASLLASLGDPAPRRGTADGLTDRLCKLLKVCQTKVILLDEFHHLLAEASVDDGRSIKICNWLKAIIRNTNVMICLVGTPECEALVNRDSQMARRFTHRFRLGELTAGTQKEPGALARFLSAMSKQFVSRLELDRFVDFDDYTHIAQMWAATSGNPAFVMLLLKEATAIALTAGRKTVVISDLAEAYAKGITLAASKVSGNPFAMSYHALSVDIGRIKLQ